MNTGNFYKDDFFKRQTTLTEIGVEGQEKLAKAKIAVVGCGGLGSIASIYLAGSGIGSIKLIDFDTINPSNLHRQVFYTLQDINQPKAKVLANYIKSITPFTEVFFEQKAINKVNISSILNEYDIVLDCTDNLSVKYLLNDFCVLHDKVLIYGSLFKFDGYVATFNYLLKEERTANLRDAFPEQPKKHIPNCSETGTLNTIVGIIGLQQANEVLKIITKVGNPLVNTILIYNSLDNSQLKLKLTRTHTKEKIQKIFNQEKYIQDVCFYQDQNLLIGKEELQIKMENNIVQIISVIENIKVPIPFTNVLKIPLSELKKNPIQLQKNKEYVIICNKGISSYEATLLLKDKNPNCTILSLKNGIEKY